MLKRAGRNTLNDRSLHRPPQTDKNIMQARNKSFSEPLSLPAQPTPISQLVSLLWCWSVFL